MGQDGIALVILIFGDELEMIRRVKHDREMMGFVSDHVLMVIIFHLLKNDESLQNYLYHGKIVEYRLYVVILLKHVLWKN
jgi:hypothetical protein